MLRGMKHFSCYYERVGFVIISNYHASWYVILYLIKGFYFYYLSDGKYMNE